MTQPHYLISLAQQLPTATLPALTKAKVEAQALLATHPPLLLGKKTTKSSDITALLAHTWQSPTQAPPYNP